MSTEKYIRITSFINRKKGVSKDDFYAYWTQVHGPLVTDFMKRYGVIEYVQFSRYTPRRGASIRTNKRPPQYHTTDETKALGAAMSAASGRPMLTYDGMTDAYVRSFSEFENAFKDPFYLEKIRPDELAFIDTESLQMTIGYNYEVIKSGNVVQEHARRWEKPDRDLLCEALKEIDRNV